MSRLVEGIAFLGLLVAITWLPIYLLAQGRR